MKPPRLLKKLPPCALFSLLSGLSASAALPTLKPISDPEWKQIAGERVDQKYEIVRGDTLYDISQRLFGDSRYWPKIWALNNRKISNPHWIRPGAEISFVPGTGTSLPGVRIADVGGTRDFRTQETASDFSGAPSSVADLLREDRRSPEWRDLPRQTWEHVPLALPPTVDAQGFDRSSRVKIKVNTGFELEAIAATEKIEPLGHISGSRSNSKNLSTGDTVFIIADSELQVGASYAVTIDPVVLKSRKSTRTGFSYAVAGEIKIIGVKEGLFIGTITKSKFFLTRGAMLMPNPPRVPALQPQTGPAPLEGVIMFDKRFGTYAAAQGKNVFIDRGTDDGVQPGMVFRSYQYHDPVNEKRITDSDFIIQADMIVTYVSPQFCVARVLRNFAPVNEDSLVVLLTDISDLNSLSGFRARTSDEVKRDRELDDLDRLDGRPLTEDERRELKQLENWKKNPPDSAPPAPAAPGADPLDPQAIPPAEDGETVLPPPPPAAEEFGEDPMAAEMETPETAPPPSAGEPLPAPADAPPPPPPSDATGNDVPLPPPPPDSALQDLEDLAP